MTFQKLILTKRDARLIKLLCDFGLASTEQLSRWIFKKINRTTVLRRLRRLEKGDYIRKRAALQNATAVWVLGVNGEKFLGSIPRRHYFPAHQLEHEITSNEIRWHLYSLSVVKNWMTEWYLKRAALGKAEVKNRSSHYQIPDALVLFKFFLKQDSAVKLEVELSLKSEMRYREKFKRYHNDRNYTDTFTWYFVKTDTMGDSILRYVKRHSQVNLDYLIGYTVISDFLEKGLEANLVLRTKALKLSRAFNIETKPQTENKTAQESAQALSSQNEQKDVKLAA